MYSLFCAFVRCTSECVWQAPGLQRPRGPHCADFWTWYMSSDAKSVRQEAVCGRCGGHGSAAAPKNRSLGCLCGLSSDPCEHWALFLRHRLQRHLLSAVFFIPAGIFKMTGSEAYSTSRHIIEDLQRAPESDYQEVYRNHVLDFLLTATVSYRSCRLSIRTV